jgi:hypothetical protein
MQNRADRRDQLAPPRPLMRYERLPIGILPAQPRAYTETVPPPSFRT